MQKISEREVIAIEIEQSANEELSAHVRQAVVLKGAQVLAIQLKENMVGALKKMRLIVVEVCDE